MKKKLLLGAFAALLAVGAQAQVHVRPGVDGDRRMPQRKSSQLAIKYGVKAGVNFSSMSNGMEFNPGFGVGNGFRAGVMMNFHWGQRTVNSLPGTGWIGLQPEVMYSYQSVKTASENIDMHYVQVPVMLKVYPISALSIEIGPEFNYLVSTTPKYLTVGGATVNTGHCKGFKMGAGIGAEYEFPVGLTIGARYSLGFSDLDKGLKWKNDGNTQITLGWLF